MMVLRVHPPALALEAPPPTVRPATTAPFNHVWMLPSVPRWYSKHCQLPVGRVAEVEMPTGERSGRVASSDSRLYIRILLWPPIRRCLLLPWAGSGMVMKLTCESVRALDALLQAHVY